MSCDILLLLLQDEKLSKNNRAYCLNRVAAVYNEWSLNKDAAQTLDLKLLDKALEYSLECIKISKQNNFPYYLALCENEVGSIYEKKIEYEIAAKFYEKSAEDFYNMGSEIDAVWAEFNYNY